MSGRDFEGFTVVVTGGSTGLGRAIAVETARRGAGVVVINFARSAEEAERLARGEDIRARDDEDEDEDDVVAEQVVEVLAEEGEEQA